MKSSLNLWFAVAVAVAVALGLSVPALKADDINVWAVESGGDVIFFHEGSINLAGFPDVSQSVTSNSLVNPVTSIYANTGATVALIPTDIYLEVLPAGSLYTFGSGPGVLATSASGDLFSFGPQALSLPENYASGSPISGSMVFENASLASLGIDPTPKSFDTSVGTNSIHLFLTPAELAAQRAARAAEISKLQRKIRKLNKKSRKLKKKGLLVKAKKLKRKIKKLQKQLAALE